MYFSVSKLHVTSRQPMAEPAANQKLLSEEQKQEIIDRLTERGVPKQCPMCATNKWVLGDGYVTQPLQGNLKGYNIGGAAIPAIPVICTNCGFISMHALGVLKLMPNVDEGTAKDQIDAASSGKPAIRP
jgi:hypothetical protein